MSKNVVSEGTKTVSSSAGWTVSEGIPVLVLATVGVLALVGLLTEAVQIQFSIMGMVFGFGLTGFLIYVNLGRKRKSTLFAELDEAAGFKVSLWMRKPRKDKWDTSMNKNVNTGQLARTRFVYLDDVMSTRVAKFNYAKGKDIIVPLRFVKDSAVLRLFLVNLFEQYGEKIKFNKKSDREELLALLTNSSNDSGRVVSSEEPVTVIGGTVGEGAAEEYEDDTVSDSEDLDIEDDMAEQDGVVSLSEPTPEPVVATQVIGYDKYRKKTVEDSVNDAVAGLVVSMDDDTREKTETPFNDLDNLNLFGTGGKSVVIELPQDSSDEDADKK